MTQPLTCYGFRFVPPFAQGLVRDLRVRWALEEAGLPYRMKLIGEGDGLVSPAAYRAVQPFGQVPAIEDGDLRLFESGAIVLHVAGKSGRLLPNDAAARCADRQANADLALSRHGAREQQVRDVGAAHHENQAEREEQRREQQHDRRR